MFKTIQELIVCLTCQNLNGACPAIPLVRSSPRSLMPNLTSVQISKTLKINQSLFEGE